jgi:hypothetical protein
VKRFEGADALPWLRYPVLFQPFDGGNLTADIYTFENGGSTIAASSGSRSVHSEIFRRHHEKLERDGLAAHFGFPVATLPKEYARLGSEFLIEGYFGADGCIVLMAGAPDVAELKAWHRCGVAVLYHGAGNTWVFQGRRHERFSCDLGLHAALVEYARRHEPHAYLVAQALLGVPTGGAHGVAAMLGDQIARWIHRSKAEGDRWAYTRAGDRVDTREAVRLLQAMPQQALQTSLQADDLVLLHTSGLL